MELKINTKERQFDDDFALLYYKGNFICRAYVDYFEECTFSDLDLPIPEGKEDDDWCEFFREELLASFDEDNQIYRLDDYIFIILDI